ncbi:hypothetical protein Q5424_18980 [Conexibacter sp. JD483]|uniref:hypothetical protein n=1 Tax=unclassified Conexibacter TaxID=2627773 RepID=UPI00271F0F11|nr:MULTISPECIES: hypothetical protein [unclassified Conexibacter]MDO8188506.1 hypothetical protein [Conexibacter sp. CPCC 205706]MDO8200150.1 hypothetical protein [Conexibacter sp. CPCC 205762]MDR9371189.1 hypothetical protein [Conexibacter sp. JD483]
MPTYRIGFAAEDPAVAEAFTDALRELLPSAVGETIAPTADAVYVLLDDLHDEHAAAHWADQATARARAIAGIGPELISTTVVAM